MPEQQQFEGLKKWPQATGLLADRAVLLQNFLKQETASNDWLRSVTYSSILLYDEHTDTLRTTAVISKDPTVAKPVTIPVKAANLGITRQAFLQGEPIFVPNVRLGEWRDQYVAGGSQTLSEMDAPLLDGGQAIGVINFESTQEGAFSSDKRRLLESIAGKAVQVCKEVDLKQEANQSRTLQNITLRVFEAINRQITRTEDLEKILKAILQAASSHLPAFFKSTILLRDSGTETLRTVAAYSNDPKFRENTIIPLNQEKGITRWAFVKKSPAHVDNVRNPPWKDLFIVVPGFKALSELDVPLLDREQEPIGVINFESTKEAAFSPDDRVFLEKLAPLVVLAVKNARQHQQRSMELALLQAISRQIIGTLELSQILQTILRAASTHLSHAFEGDIFLYDADSRTLNTAAFYSSNDPTVIRTSTIDLNQKQGISKWVFENKRPAHVDNVRKDPPWNDLYIEIPGFPSLSEISVPLLDGEQAIGVINFESAQEAAFSPDDRIFLEELAKQAVLAVKSTKTRPAHEVEDNTNVSNVMAKLVGQTNQLELAIKKIETNLVRTAGTVDKIESLLTQGNTALEPQVSKIADLTSELEKAVRSLGEALEKVPSLEADANNAIKSVPNLLGELAEKINNVTVLMGSQPSLTQVPTDMVTRLGSIEQMVAKAENLVGLLLGDHHSLPLQARADEQTPDHKTIEINPIIVLSALHKSGPHTLPSLQKSLKLEPTLYLEIISGFKDMGLITWTEKHGGKIELTRKGEQFLRLHGEER